MSAPLACETPATALTPPAAQKYTVWRRSILLGIVISIVLGATKGGIYGWAPAAATFYSLIHFMDSVAKTREGIFARLFLVVTQLQRILDIENFILSPIRPSVATR